MLHRENVIQIIHENVKLDSLVESIEIAADKIVALSQDTVVDQKDEKTIYDLKLHEWLTIGPHCFAQKVPGGWVYKHTSDRLDEGPTAVFVPYYKAAKE
jgi:hypothetical protein